MKIIATYKVNRFLTNIIYDTLFISLLIFGLIKMKPFEYDDIIRVFGLLLALYLSKDIWYILFCEVTLINGKKKFVIEKRIFNVMFFKKEIIRPFDIELVDNLKSQFFIGTQRNWLRRYHKKGLRFTNNKGNVIYEIGLNDNLNADLIFKRID